MRFVGAGMVALSLLGPLLAAGCAGRRIEQGVYYSNKGYHVRIPGPEWTVVEESRADLELRPRSGQAGMLANATCEAQVARRSASVLQRQLLLGLPERRAEREAERERPASDRLVVHSHVSLPAEAALPGAQLRSVYPSS